jgi:hypothetical protein
MAARGVTVWDISLARPNMKSPRNTDDFATQILYQPAYTHEELTIPIPPYEHMANRLRDTQATF